MKVLSLLSIFTLILVIPKPGLTEDVEIEWSMTLEVLSIEGQTEGVEISAESIKYDNVAHGFVVPYATFPDGRKALIDSMSGLSSRLCSEIEGKEIYNPYRDLRIPYLKYLSYKRGLFDNTYMISNINGTYKEVPVLSADHVLFSLHCTTY